MVQLKNTKPLIPTEAHQPTATIARKGSRPSPRLRAAGVGVGSSEPAKDDAPEIFGFAFPFAGPGGILL